MSAEDQSWSPRVSGKTTTTTAAGAAVTVLVWVLSLVGIDMPAEVAAALVVLVMGISAYVLPVRERGKYEA